MCNFSGRQHQYGVRHVSGASTQQLYGGDVAFHIGRDSAELQLVIKQGFRLAQTLVYHQLITQRMPQSRTASHKEQDLN